MIAAPAEVCFDAALDVGIHQESSSFTGERLVPPGRMSGRLQHGDLVAFEGRHFGVRQRFVARITAMDRPSRFVDEMVEGVFTSLRHIHEFEPAGDGTLMRDILEWTAPLGIAGRVADRLFLESHMEGFVTRKQRNMGAIIERSLGPSRAVASRAD